MSIPLSHVSLTKLADLLEVSDPHGLCYGGVGTWMNALFQNDTETFYNRFKTLGAYLDKPESLGRALNDLKTKVKSGSPLEESEINLLEIEAFLQIQRVMLDSDGILDDEGKPIAQRDLEKKLNLFTDNTNIEAINHFARPFTKESLATYLETIAPYLGDAQSQSPYPLMIAANGHGMGIRFNEGTWEVFDLNFLGRKCPEGLKSNLSATEVAEEIVKMTTSLLHSAEPGFILADIQTLGQPNDILKAQLEAIENNLTLDSGAAYLVDMHGNALANISPKLEEHLNALKASFPLDIEALLLPEENDCFAKNIFYHNVSFKQWSTLIGEVEPAKVEALLFKALKDAVSHNAVSFASEACRQLSPESVQSAAFSELIQNTVSRSNDLSSILIERYLQCPPDLPVASFESILPIKNAFYSGRKENVESITRLYQQLWGNSQIHFEDGEKSNALIMALRFGDEALVQWTIEQMAQNPQRFVERATTTNSYGRQAMDYAALYHKDLLPFLAEHIHHAEEQLATPPQQPLSQPEDPPSSQMDDAKALLKGQGIVDEEKLQIMASLYVELSSKPSRNDAMEHLAQFKRSEAYQQLQQPNNWIEKILLFLFSGLGYKTKMAKVFDAVFNEQKISAAISEHVTEESPPQAVVIDIAGDSQQIVDTLSNEGVAAVPIAAPLEERRPIELSDELKAPAPTKDEPAPEATLEGPPSSVASPR